MDEEVSRAPDGVRSGRIVGDLTSLSLAEIVQTLSLGGRTGAVALTSRGRSGRMWFVDGSATHAETGEKTGEAAVYEMLAWKRGRFVIEDGIVTEMRTLDGDTMLMVLEGLRRIDEKNASARGETNDPSFEPCPGPASVPGRSKRRRVAGVLGVISAISLVGPLFIGMKAIVSSGDKASAGPAAAADAVAPSSKILLATRQRSSAGPAPVYFDRPEFWMMQMNLSPETDEQTEPDAQAVETIEDTDPPHAIEEARVEPSIEEERSIPDPEEPVSQPEEFPVSIEPSYVDLVVKSNVKSGLLVVSVDGQSVYSQALKEKVKSVKRFLRKVTGRADERFEATLEIDPGPHEIVARVEIHGKKTSYERRLEIDLASGGRETVQVSVGRAFGKRLAMGIVTPTTSDEIIE